MIHNRNARAIVTLLLMACLLPAMVSCRGQGVFAGSGRASPARPNPMDANAAVERATRLKQQGLNEVALAELERAIAINPKLTTAYVEIGEIHRVSGNYAKAEQAYSQAATLEPRNFDAQYFHGLTLQMLNRLNEAVRAYLRALAIRPEDFDANLNLATAYLQLGEPAEALLYGKRAVKLKGDNAAARVNLGAIHAALNDHESAVIEYRQAAELMELTPQLLLNLADSLGKIGLFAEMQATLEQSLRLQPSAVAYERLGSAHFRLRSYDEALVNFRKALEMDSDHYPALNGVGVCLLNRYLWSNKTDNAAREEALQHLRRSLQIERRQPRVFELVSRYG